MMIHSNKALSRPNLDRSRPRKPHVGILNKRRVSQKVNYSTVHVKVSRLLAKKGEGHNNIINVLNTVMPVHVGSTAKVDLHVLPVPRSRYMYVVGLPRYMYFSKRHPAWQHGSMAAAAASDGTDERSLRTSIKTPIAIDILQCGDLFIRQ